MSLLTNWQHCVGSAALVVVLGWPASASAATAATEPSPQVLAALDAIMKKDISDTSPGCVLGLHSKNVDVMRAYGQADLERHVGMDVDSVFNVPRSHAIAVCDEIERRENPLPWVCYASPVALDEEVVRAMARAGCRGVEIGSDSGTPRMLEQLKKPFSIEHIAASRALFRTYGIHDCHTFVLGALDETPDEVKETLAFVARSGA